MSLATTFNQRSSFVMTATAAAVGLGNIWRFPYLLGEYGGGTFLFIYVLALLVLAMPVLVAEAVLARHDSDSVFDRFHDLRSHLGLSRVWFIIPALGLLAALGIFSYYAVVAGWTVAYFKPMYDGLFADSLSREAGSFFNQLLGQTKLMALHTGVYISLLVLLLALNIQWGVAKLMRLLIPYFIICLILLAVYALKFGDAERAYQFFWQFDVSLIDSQLILAAAGQAFYSLSIGCAMMLSLGRYAPRQYSLISMLGWVVSLDTLVALLASLAIYPIILSFDIRPEYGPSLLFVAMPYAFGQMLYGEFFGLLFLLMVFSVALASGVALLTPWVNYISQRFNCWRILSALVVGGMIMGLAGLSVLSLSNWQHIEWFGVSLFQWPDWLVSHVLLPTAALLTAFLVGWRIRSVYLRDLLHYEPATLFWLWLWCLRLVTTPLMAALLVYFIYSALP